MYTAVPDYILESARALSPLPEAAQQLLAQAHQDKADFTKITRLVALDPSLTARTLRAANSERYTANRSIDNVMDAVEMMGDDAVGRLSIGACALGAKARHPAFDVWAFWRHVFAVAMLSRLIAEEQGADPVEAYVSGLLHDIGKLIMLEHYGDLYVQVLLAAQYGAAPLHVLERDMFHLDHAAVGHGLCLHWNIPHAVTLSVAQHHDASPPARGSSADIVRDANDLVKSYCIGMSGNRFAELRPVVGLPHSRVAPSRLREIMAALPGILDAAEGDLRGRSPEAPAAPGAGRPRVHLGIGPAEDHELLAAALDAAGYEPVADGSGPLVACILDAHAHGAPHGAPVLDYAAWRAAHLQRAEHPCLDTYALQRWLAAELGAAHPCAV